MRCVAQCRAALLAIAAMAPLLLGADAPATMDEKPFAKNGCSIQFPKGWTLADVVGAQAFVFARAPAADTHDGEQFWANININRTSASNLEMLPAAREFQARHKERYGDYQVTDEPAAITVNGQKGVTFGGTFTARGVKLRNKQWYVPAGDRGYWITMTALASAWSKRAAEADAAVETFTAIPEKK